VGQLCLADKNPWLVLFFYKATRIACFAFVLGFEVVAGAVVILTSSLRAKCQITLGTVRFKSYVELHIQTMYLLQMKTFLKKHQHVVLLNFTLNFNMDHWEIFWDITSLLINTFFLNFVIQIFKVNRWDFQLRQDLRLDFVSGPT
jgi:hypothetical protein